MIVGPEFFRLYSRIAFARDDPIEGDLSLVYSGEFVQDGRIVLAERAFRGEEYDDKILLCSVKM